MSRANHFICHLSNRPVGAILTEKFGVLYN
jgi:hypothetical protein